MRVCVLASCARLLECAPAREQQTCERKQTSVACVRATACGHVRGREVIVVGGVRLFFGVRKGAAGMRSRLVVGVYVERVEVEDDGDE